MNFRVSHIEPLETESVRETSISKFANAMESDYVSSTATSAIQRDSSLDAARGVLMMLGVIIHASDIYSTGDNWLFQDSRTSVAFDTITDIIHAFRMPVFFWIAGYFCGLTVSRYGSVGLLRNRAPRLLIPLITTWLSLNVIQALLVASLTGKGAMETILAGIPSYHLWFLIDLIIFIFGAALIFPCLKYFHFLTKRIETLPILLLFPILALFALSISLFVRATGVAYESILGLTSIFRIATYVPYFIGGIFMFGRPEVKKTFLKVPAIFVLATLPLAVFFDGETHGEIFIIDEFAFFAKELMVWLTIAAVLRFFQILVTRESSFTRFLSDAAYTVYLFHHVLVVMVGIALLDVEISPWWKFLIVSSTSLIASAFIHAKVIRRYPIAQLLFNGK